MANKEDIKFVDGLIVKAPHENAPDFVKASISIKVVDLGKWLKAEYKAGNKDWINIDVKEAKSGRWYAAVSTFKPRSKEQREAAEPRDEDIIPF